MDSITASTDKAHGYNDTAHQACPQSENRYFKYSFSIEIEGMCNNKILDDYLKCAPTYFVQIIYQLFYFLNINYQPDQWRSLNAES